MLLAKRAEKDWFVPPIVTFWGILVANEVKKFEINLFGGKTVVCGAPLCLFLATSTHFSDTQS